MEGAAAAVAPRLPPSRSARSKATTVGLALLWAEPLAQLPAPSDPGSRRSWRAPRRWLRPGGRRIGEALLEALADPSPTVSTLRYADILERSLKDTPAQRLPVRDVAAALDPLVTPVLEPFVAGLQQPFTEVSAGGAAACAAAQAWLGAGRRGLARRTRVAKWLAGGGAAMDRTSERPIPEHLLPPSACQPEPSWSVAVPRRLRGRCGPR